MGSSRVDVACSMRTRVGMRQAQLWRGVRSCWSLHTPYWGVWWHMKCTSPALLVTPKYLRICIPCALDPPQIRSQLNEKWPRIVEHAARVAKSLPATQVGWGGCGR